MRLLKMLYKSSTYELNNRNHEYSHYVRQKTENRTLSDACAQKYDGQSMCDWS